MSLTAKDLMQTNLLTVPSMTHLVDLERKFVEDNVGGFPVVDGGRLVGIVTRSDVIRTLSVEQSMSEMASDYFHTQDLVRDPVEEFAEIATRVGHRLDDMCVKDVMVTNLVTVSSDASIEDVAKKLVESRIHRVLVTDSDTLVGIISSLEFVRLFAAGKARVE